MLTKAFNQMVVGRWNGGTVPFLTVNDEEIGIEFRFTTAYSILNIASNLATCGNGYGLLVVGSNDETEQISNNKITIIDDSQFSTVSSQATTDVRSGQILYTRTMTYNGVEPVEIKEVGFYFNSKGGSSSPSAMVLLAREVLDSPITVHNGDTFTVSMTIG